MSQQETTSAPMENEDPPRLSLLVFFFFSVLAVLVAVFVLVVMAVVLVVVLVVVLPASYSSYSLVLAYLLALLAFVALLAWVVLDFDFTMVLDLVLDYFDFTTASFAFFVVVDVYPISPRATFIYAVVVALVVWMRRAPKRTDVASKTIDSRGGTIQLRHYGISLCIPALALQKDCKITLKVLPHPSNILIAENEAIVSPGVVCEPSGTTFKRPLKLIIPHCAVLTDPSKAKVILYFTHGDTKVTKKELSSIGTPRCVVRKDELEVYINHFSCCDVVMVISEYFTGKRMASTPYIPKAMNCLETQYCHLRLYNDYPGIEDLIETEEGKLDYCKMAPTKKMFVHWRKGELNITCEIRGGEILINETMKTVSLDDIYRLDRNVLSFLVQPTSYAVLRLTFNFHPHSDEGQTFLVKFSEAPQGNTAITSTIQPLRSPISSRARAAAAVSELTTSTAREVSDEMLNKLAKKIPFGDYNTFSEKLGINQNQARNIVIEHANNYANATRDCLEKWKNRSTRTVADLHEVLRAADLAGLIFHCN